MIAPFRTAVWALGAGSLLIAAAALYRDDSPRCQFLADRQRSPAGAKRTAPAGMTGAILTTEAAAPRSNGAKSPRAIESKASRSIARSLPAISVPAPAVPSHVFHNASLQKSARSGPTIEIGPLVESTEPPAAGAAKAAISTRPTIALKAEVRSAAANTRLVTRLYRPNATSALELERLFQPLLTPGTGSAIANKNAASGDKTADAAVAMLPDVLLVRDRPEVVSQIDAVYSDLEAARRIVIDALVADIALADSVPSDWETRQFPFGVIEAEPRAVVKTLRQRGRVNVIATNQLHIVDRQWGQLQWTERIGRSPGEPAQDASPFLDTKFRVRPSILANGRVRLEVNPTSSQLKERPGARPEMATVAFTTDIVLATGATALIAGSLEDSSSDFDAASPTIGDSKLGRAVKICPRSSVRHQIILLLAPRISAGN